MKNIKTILITVVVTALTTFGIFTFMNNQGLSFSNDLSDGSYITEQDNNGEYMTLTVEGDKVIVSAFGMSKIGTIDRDKKEFKVEGEDSPIKYDLVGGKLHVSMDGSTNVVFIKDKGTTKEKSKEESKEEKTKVSNVFADEFEGKLEEVVDSSVGTNIKLFEKKADGVIDGYDDVNAIISYDYYDQNGEMIFDEDTVNYNVVELLTLDYSEPSDEDDYYYINMEVVVEKAE